MAKLLKLHLQ